MTRLQARLQHLANLLVGGTGVVYFVFKYLTTSDDPFAVVNHPWQPHAQHLHVLFAPALVFAVGWLWQRHAWARLKAGRRDGRRSGATLIFTAAPMIASGYLLQISVEEFWRTVWVWTHVGVSTVWILGYLAHQFAPRRPASSPR